MVLPRVFSPPRLGAVPLHFLLSDLWVVLVCVSVLCLNEGSSARAAPAPYKRARKPFPRVYQQPQALKPAFSSFGRSRENGPFFSLPLPSLSFQVQSISKNACYCYRMDFPDMETY